MNYGVELVIDASGCDTSVMNRKDLEIFLAELCKKIDMNRALQPFFWDEENGGSSNEPHLKGVSVMQFIETSNIVIHTLTKLEIVFLNIFTCKDFDHEVAKEYVRSFFKARDIKTTLLDRTYFAYPRTNSRF